MRIDLRTLLSKRGMTIDIRVQEPLPEGIEDFEGIFFCQPIEVEAQLTNKGEGRLCLTGRAKVTYESCCACCLKPVRQNLEIELAADYVPKTAYQEATFEEDVYPYQDKELDLDELLRTELLANAPMRVLCTTGCRGLCSHCGIDLNTATCACAEAERMKQSPFGKLLNLNLKIDN